MAAWLDSITTWLTANPSWLGVAIMLVAFVECLAIAGIIVPGTVALFAIATLAGSGILPLGETLLLGFAGGLLGDAVSYFLGRRFHQSIRRLPGRAGRLSTCCPDGPPAPRFACRCRKASGRRQL